MTIIRVRRTMDCVLTAVLASTLAATCVIAVKVSEFHRTTTSLASVNQWALLHFYS